MYNFKEVTLLITHYNRSNSLERLLAHFEELNCTFGDIIVSDDCSKPEQVQKLNLLSNRFGFRLITSPINKGLANNINKGQDAVQTPYTLYVQEDFVPQPIFPEKLEASVQFLINDQKFDMVRFYAYFKYPYLKPFKDGFSEMIFSIWNLGYKKFYFYSDHPHLRRSNFFEKFGRYIEGIKSDDAEYKMMISFLKHSGTALYYDDYQGLFDQVNSEAEPSTVKRNSLRESNHFIIAAARHIYRHLKFNFDYLR